MLFKYSEENIQERKSLSDISNLELLEVCSSLYNNSMDDVVNFGLNENLAFYEELDGINCSFGIDENEDVFLNVDDYDDVDDAKEFIKRNGSVITALEEIYDHYGPVKMECTMFPTFSHEGDERGNVTFEALTYDKKKFGTQGAFVVNEVKSWSAGKKDYVPAVEKVNRSIFGRLQESDNSKWRMYNESNTLMAGKMKVDLSELVDLLSDENKYNSALAVLENEEGHPHRNILENVLAKVKPKLENAVRQYVRKSTSTFGKLTERSNIKGSVLKVKTPRGLYQFKIDNDSYEKLKAAKYSSRENIKELEALANQNFFNDVFGFDVKDGSQIDDAIRKVANNFRSNKTGEQRINQYLNNVIDELKQEGFELSEQDVKENALGSILSAKEQLRELKAKVNAEETDADTKRKVEKVLGQFEKKIEFIEKHIGSKAYTGQAYVLYILKLILAPKLGDLMGRIEEKLNEDGSVGSNAVPAERVLLFLNKSQPWTKTDDAMLQEAKQRLGEYGANKIYVVVDGFGYEGYEPVATVANEEFETLKESPVSFQKRIDLLEALYEDDMYVEVCPVGLKNNEVTSILETVFLRENKQVIGAIVPSNETKKYGKRWGEFDKANWQENYCNDLPLVMRENSPAIGMVGVGNAGISQVKSRQLVKEVGWDTWKEVVTPVGISESALEKYKAIYDETYDMYATLAKEEYRGQLKNIFGS